MNEQNIVAYLKQFEATFKRHEAQITANRYLLLLLAKDSSNLGALSNKYGELLIQVSQKENVDIESLEEMKMMLHTLHQMFIDRNDYSKNIPLDQGDISLSNDEIQPAI